MIDVVVPVYKGAEVTWECVRRLLHYPQTTTFEILIVDDASPEPEMRSLLEELSREPRVKLIRNAENLGFVKSVNKALGLHSDRDVVLLNSDAFVSGDWLDRLCAHLKSERVASVTPYSNNATICSYPLLDGQESWPLGFSSWEETDRAFAVLNRGVSRPLPSGVGFCMAMKRSVIEAIGLFNEELFGKGYGEEVEWCLRARRHNYAHVIAADVYVAHVGAVSFGESHRSQKVIEATSKIEKLYPEWQGLLQSHLESSPDSELRQRVDLLRSLKDSRVRVLHVSHSQGGGIEAHVRDVAFARPDLAHWVLKVGRKSWDLSTLDAEFVLGAENASFDLKDLVEKIGFDFVHVHHVMHLQESALEAFASLSVPYGVTLHDYFFVCPQVNLLNQADVFCGLPELATCERCVKDKVPDFALSSVIDWRVRYGSFLRGAREIIAPTASVRSYYARVFKELEGRIQVVSHPDLLDPVLDKTFKATVPERELRVLLLGALDVKKGLLQVEALLKMNISEKAYVELIHLGAPSESLKNFKGYKWLGEEKSLSHIYEICRNENVHAAWLPSHCPETYSYALSRCLRLGLPIVATRIGAFSDRLEEGEGVALVEVGAPAEIHFEALYRISQNPQPARSKDKIFPEYWKTAYSRMNSPYMYSFDQTISKALVLLRSYPLNNSFHNPSNFDIFENTRRIWLRMRTSQHTAWLIKLVPRQFVRALKRMIKRLS